MESKEFWKKVAGVFSVCVIFYASVGIIMMSCFGDAEGQYRKPNYPIPPKGAYTDSVEINKPAIAGDIKADSIRAKALHIDRFYGVELNSGGGTDIGRQNQGWFKYAQADTVNGGFALLNSSNTAIAESQYSTATQASVGGFQISRWAYDSFHTEETYDIRPGLSEVAVGDTIMALRFTNGYLDTDNYWYLEVGTVIYLNTDALAISGDITKVGTPSLMNKKRVFVSLRRRNVRVLGQEIYDPGYLAATSLEDATSGFVVKSQDGTALRSWSLKDVRDVIVGPKGDSVLVGSFTRAASEGGLRGGQFFLSEPAGNAAGKLTVNTIAGSARGVFRKFWRDDLTVKIGVGEYAVSATSITGSGVYSASVTRSSSAQAASSGSLVFSFIGDIVTEEGLKIPVLNTHPTCNSGAVGNQYILRTDWKFYVCDGSVNQRAGGGVGGPDTSVVGFRVKAVGTWDTTRVTFLADSLITETRAEGFGATDLAATEACKVWAESVVWSDLRERHDSGHIITENTGPDFGSRSLPTYAALSRDRTMCMLGGTTFGVAFSRGRLVPGVGVAKSWILPVSVDYGAEWIQEGGSSASSYPVINRFLGSGDGSACEYPFGTRFIYWYDGSKGGERGWRIGVGTMTDYSLDRFQIISDATCY